MKRFTALALIMVSIIIFAVTVVNADCTPAPTSGDDTIVCTGTTTGGIDGDDGNDRITNNGTLSDNVTGDMIGGDGDDTLINNGTVQDAILGGDDDDTIINNGLVMDDIYGDEGNDTVINNGTINEDLRTNDGNDTVTNNGTINEDIISGEGNDFVVNNGTINEDIFDENGNNTIINNGIIVKDVTLVRDGDDVVINNGFIGDDVTTANGNDIVINNGTIISGITSGDGDDMLINNGFIDEISTGDDNDTLVNNGIVNDEVRLGNDNDMLINNGFIGGDVSADFGDDYVIMGNGAVVGGIISGGDGFDTLQFDVSACYETDGETIRATLSIPDLDPASDTVTLHGNTYTWVEFEELISTLFTQFCDGRIEVTDTATPLVSYCNIFNGLDIYDVNEIGVDGRSTEGLLTIRTTQLETREIVQLAVSTGVNQLIASDEYGNQLWALSSNELQIMGPEVTDPTKTYTFILPAEVCGIN